MKNQPDDRGLFVIACANIKSAKDNLQENDEVFVNFALFNIAQSVEKLLKFLCTCYGIDYDYSHFLISISDKLLEKGVKIPQLVISSLSEYASWATRGRYVASQLVMKSYAEKHILCIEAWIDSIEKQMLLQNPYKKKPKK